LGKMACRARPERQVRNPATGETMTKAADKSVKFSIAKSLKDIVNG
jgi:DNA-binding protein HU-beta